jgi:hypothetical protein
MEIRRKRSLTPGRKSSLVHEPCGVMGGLQLEAQ